MKIVYNKYFKYIFTSIIIIISVFELYVNNNNFQVLNYQNLFHRASELY